MCGLLLLLFMVTATTACSTYGPTLSLHDALPICSTIVPFASAQDHKRVGDGDTGPNTGGMGAYSPAPVLTPMLEAEAMIKIIAPTVRTLADEGMPYSGVLFLGVMLTREGPKLIE